jgi:arylsulfatase A-like enzyme
MMLKGPIHYEALVRVPLIVRGPGIRPARSSRIRWARSTSCPPASAPWAAVPAWVEGAAAAPTARASGRSQRTTSCGSMSFRTLTTRRHRLTRSLHDPDGGEPYDLANDPGELENRWADPGRRMRAEPPRPAGWRDEARSRRTLPVICQAG